MQFQIVYVTCFYLHLLFPISHKKLSDNMIINLSSFLVVAKASAVTFYLHMKTIEEDYNYYWACEGSSWGKITSTLLFSAGQGILHAYQSNMLISITFYYFKYLADISITKNSSNRMFSYFLVVNLMSTFLLKVRLGNTCYCHE